VVDEHIQHKIDSGYKHVSGRQNKLLGGVNFKKGPENWLFLALSDTEEKAEQNKKARGRGQMAEKRVGQGQWWQAAEI